MSDIDKFFEGIAALNALRPTVDNLGRMIQVDPPHRQADRKGWLYRGEATDYQRELLGLERQHLRNNSRIAPFTGGINEGWGQVNRFQSEFAATSVQRREQLNVQGNEIAAIAMQRQEQIDVAWTQKTCNELGFNCGAVDNIWGPKTQAGVDAFRKAAGLGHLIGSSTMTNEDVMAMQNMSGTGRAVGQSSEIATVAASRDSVKIGNKKYSLAGEVDVAWTQKTCNELGFNCGAVDDVWGPKTQAGVDAFRQAVGLNHLVGSSSMTTEDVMVMQNMRSAKRAVGQSNGLDVSEDAVLVSQRSLPSKPNSAQHWSQRSQGGDR